MEGSCPRCLRVLWRGSFRLSGAASKVSKMSWVRRSVAATLDARRALLADLSSYGVRRLPSRGDPAGRLGRRLAADLELVRTRGIRLFN